MKLTDTQKLLRKMHSDAVRNGRNSYVVYLKIDHQSFRLEGNQSKKAANWMRDQIAVAIFRLLYGPR